MRPVRYWCSPNMTLTQDVVTRVAEDEARNQEKRWVMLLDLRRFFDLWVEHYEKIPEANRRFLPALGHIW
jgi:hypothetical protein